MKNTPLIYGAMVGIILVNSATAQTVFTGDTKLACEAILCLSSGQRPAQCAPSIARYFSISSRRLADTIQGRVNFLALCPAANVDPTMKSLVNAIANGAGQCDAAALNSQLMTTSTGEGQAGYSISNLMPSNCLAYNTHAYTADLQKTAVVYVGVPERHGFWADKATYALALAEYNARIAREDADRELASQGGGG